LPHPDTNAYAVPDTHTFADSHSFAHAYAVAHAHAVAHAYSHAYSLAHTDAHHYSGHRCRPIARPGQHRHLVGFPSGLLLTSLGPANHR
jgi:hypothetical protein